MRSDADATFLSCAQAITYSDEKASKISVASSDHSRVNLWCLKKGQGIHPHVHNGDHVWVVMEGSGNYLDGEKKQPVKKGDILFVPAGLPHGIENDGEGGLVFVSVSTT